MTNEPYATEMRGWALLRSRVSGWYIRNISRRIPRLVWIGDEIDLRVTFKDIGALYGDSKSLDRIFEADKIFRDMGINFDTGSGCHGRDWEWDHSLSGPISVVFRGMARNPERRTLRPKLKLVS